MTQKRKNTIVILYGTKEERTVKLIATRPDHLIIWFRKREVNWRGKWRNHKEKEWRTLSRQQSETAVVCS